MRKVEVFDEEQKLSSEKRQEIVNFLYEHLGKYGDSKEDIGKAIDYAVKSYESFGGFVLVSFHNQVIVGCVVVNSTGMEGYIPENILVYIATHKDYRGKGIGKELMNEALNRVDGAIALHVEPDNPARLLYEKLGFTSKYLEMRLV